MGRRCRLLAFLAVAAAVAAVWRPWQQGGPAGRPPLVSPRLEPILDPARQVTVVVVNRTGRPCQVRVAGSAGGTLTTLIVPLTADPGRQEMRVGGPFTLTDVTVDQDGRPV